jgi:outer membrane lipase/esterase
MPALSRFIFTSIRLITAQASLVLALASGLFLTACGSGSGTPVEPLVPSARMASFGDGLSDLGQTGSKFTVNDGTVNIWVERVATNYGLTITASVSGGLGYARGGARVNTGANSIADQISAYLGANTIGAKDVLIVDAGVAELAALAIDHPTDTAMAAAAKTAGANLAAQVLRLTAAGGKYVVIANAPDLGKTPFATAQGRATGFTAATRAFNDELKIALAGVTSGVLLIDNEAFVNAIYNSPGSLGSGGNVTASACPGVATACTTANANSSYGVYLFADDRHLAPTAHRLLGDNAYSRIKSRW